jgi:hypothetical protein
MVTVFTMIDVLPADAVDRDASETDIEKGRD